VETAAQSKLRNKSFPEAEHVLLATPSRVGIHGANLADFILDLPTDIAW
jgi:hypothetical protein